MVSPYVVHNEKSLQTAKTKKEKRIKRKSLVNPNWQGLCSGECGQHPCPAKNRRACSQGPVQHEFYVDVSGDSRVQWSDETQ
ncbi:hypothetical protein TNCV_1049401 [Trichonephila clavipes]|nr:hypothetical protein TNCV_1049401 [Trichonephila clavipes]